VQQFQPLGPQCNREKAHARHVAARPVEACDETAGNWVVANRAWPLVARAQQPERTRRVGVLMNDAATETIPQSYVAEFVQGLRQLGWIEGRNLRIEVRWNAGDAALARIYAAQLIGLTPDVILAASTTNLTIIRQGTSTIPVVFVRVTDPLEQRICCEHHQAGRQSHWLQHVRVFGRREMG
jgi:hypothetical protein